MNSASGGENLPGIEFLGVLQTGTIQMAWYVLRVHIWYILSGKDWASNRLRHARGHDTNCEMLCLAVLVAKTPSLANTKTPTLANTKKPTLANTNTNKL